MPTGPRSPTAGSPFECPQPSAGRGFSRRRAAACCARGVGFPHRRSSRPRVTPPSPAAVPQLLRGELLLAIERHPAIAKEPDAQGQFVDATARKPLRCFARLRGQGPPAASAICKEAPRRPERDPRGPRAAPGDRWGIPDGVAERVRELITEHRCGVNLLALAEPLDVFARLPLEPNRDGAALHRVGQPSDPGDCLGQKLEKSRASIPAPAPMQTVTAPPCR